MPGMRSVSLVAIACVIASAAPVGRAADVRPRAPELASHRGAFGHTPARFEANTGQFGSGVLFAGRGFGRRVLFDAGGVDVGTGGARTVRITIPTSRDTRVEGVGATVCRANYFVGNHPAAWRTNVRSYDRVVYRDAQPGVDVVFYDRGGALEYDVVIAPGADPCSARFAFPDAETRIDASGDLVVTSAGAALRMHAPVAYQEGPRDREVVAARFARGAHGEVGFAVGAYDPARTLTIDPPIVFSTLYGGSQSDEIFDMAVGLDGSIYACGVTFSADLPVVGGIDAELGSTNDFFVAKFAPGGGALEFATYLGGNANEFSPRLAVDSSGAVTVVGATFATDYPTVNALQPAPRNLLEGVVTKFAPDGASLVYSTYLGGSMNDYVNGVALRPDGSAVIAGQTASFNFPVDGASPGFGGQTDGYVAEIAPDGSALEHSRYVGGSSFEGVGDVVLDLDGNAYVAFTSESANFPGGNASGGKPCLVSIDPAWNAVMARVVDPGADGRIGGLSMARRPGGLVFTGYRETVPASRGGSNIDAIVYATDYDGALVGTRLIAGPAAEIGRDVAVDADGRVYVVCDAQSAGLPSIDAPFQTGYGGGIFDVYLAQLAPGTLEVERAGYLGGVDYDEAKAVATDTLGNVYIGGVTASHDFVATPGAFQTVIAGNGDGFVLKALSANTAGVFELDWFGPDTGTLTAPPRALVATRASGSSEASRRSVDVAGYRVYRSTTAGVVPSRDTFYFFLPGGGTATGPIVAGGGYFVVTGVYPDGTETEPSGEVGAGVGEGTITSVTITTKKVVITGHGFTSPAAVFIDGVAFAAPAKVKSSAKVNQKGALATGQTVSAYLDAHGGTAVLSVRNANGAAATYRLTQ